MVLRSGIDLVDISRLETINPAIRNRFIERIFTPLEISEVGNSNERIAGGFAAKEAVSKALGCGFGPIDWHEVIIHHLSSGEPFIELQGKAIQFAQTYHLTQWSISISHTKTHAVAMVVALGVDD